MTYPGTVRNGVVVLPDGVALPEGVEVDVVVRTSEPEGRPAGVGAMLAELARRAETQPCALPADLAENHDHYLHGRPKR